MSKYKVYTPHQDARIARAVVAYERSGQVLPTKGRNDRPQVLQIVVRANQDIQAEQSGECIRLRGDFGAFNAELDRNGSPVTVTVWNLGTAELKDGQEFVANWTASKSSRGAWVAAIGGREESTDSPRLWRAVVTQSGGIADGGTGNIRVNQQTQIGQWEHCTSGFDLLEGGDIWAWGPLPNGLYDIIDADCRFVE